VVNNDVIRGLHRKYFRHLQLVKHSSDTAHAMTRRGEAATGGGQQGFVSKIHELEGRLAQETLEKRLLKEDKDKVISVMNELKVKYQQLFNNELEIRKELLSCEQEKLALSKAFVDFQMEKNAQIQDLDNEKFEIENKLIQAEEMVVQIQQDDHKKASQIQDLCQKMNEIIHEKRTLGEELTLLQKHCQDLEHKLNEESKKNQQLSLELIVLVNQRQKSVGDAEALGVRQRDMTKQLKELEVSHANLASENNQHQSRVSKLEHDIETMRKEIARKEIDIEKLELVNQRVKVDIERQHEGLLQNQESERAKAHAAAVAENAALFNEKSQLQQTLERAQADLMRAEKDRDSLHADYIKKSQEYEEILVTNERLQHDLQSQLEEFRLQLSFVTSTPEVHQGMRALMHSYQSRERELRGQVALQQQRLQRMRQARSRNGSPQADVFPDSTAALSDSTVKADDLIERLHAAERQVVEHMTAATVASENENRLNHLVTKLAKENEELRSLLNKPTHPDRSELEATREVQALILQQLEQVRKLARSTQPANHQLQQKTSVAPALAQDTPAQQLLVTKDEQEQKIFSKQAEWMQSVEQVERRCADLFTKNVMLTEENEQLRTTLKV
jgi:chromosome segregation ATPase